MKTTVTIDKSEIAKAVTKYMLERISAGYRHNLTDLQLNFSNKDGDIGYFTATLEAEVKPKDEEKEDD